MHNADHVRHTPPHGSRRQRSAFARSRLLKVLLSERMAHEVCLFASCLEYISPMRGRHELVRQHLHSGSGAGSGADSGSGAGSGADSDAGAGSGVSRFQVFGFVWDSSRLVSPLARPVRAWCAS